MELEIHFITYVTKAKYGGTVCCSCTFQKQFKLQT